MKKILIFSHGLAIGGAERALLGLLETIDTVIMFVYMIFTAIGAGVGHSLVTASLDKNYKDFNTLQ